MSRPYFGLREYRRRLFEREASGEDLWADRLNETTRIKLVHVIRGFMNDANLHYMIGDELPKLTQAINYQFGIISLSSSFGFRANSPHEEVIGAILAEGCEEEIIFSLLEAFWDILPRYPQSSISGPREQYTNEIRLTLEDCRISYDFVEGNIIPRSRQVIHSAVVVPTVTLLSGRKNFEEAETRYMQSLQSIKEHRYDDAITDAVCALEAILDALQCEGNTLDKKFRVALQLNLLAAHDKRLMDWISADRVAKGDPHSGDKETTKDDAWLVVHVTGALILRLAEDEVR